MSIVRLLLVLAAAMAAASLVPVSGGPSNYAAASVLAVIFLLATVMLKAVERQKELDEWIALELNKIRRVYHLGRNLGETDRLRAWFTDLHGYVYGYLSAFEEKDFSRYEETNGAFRKLSYHVYQIEDLKTEKERALYDELLDAAGEVAGARQRIRQLREGGLPGEVWTVLLASAAIASAAVLLSIGPADRLVAGFLLSVLWLAALLVRDLDGMKSFSSSAPSKKYVENIARLELSRDRGETEA